MTNKQPEQLSFLLRLYRIRGEPGTQPITGRTVWRISLENARTRQRQGFASLDDLFDFLREQMGLLSASTGDQVHSVPSEHDEFKNDGSQGG